jgi:hypothetical protein
LAYARDQMGHSSITITVDTYGHSCLGVTAPRWTTWTNHPDASLLHRESVDIENSG